MTELLDTLRRHANNRGLVIVREAVLSEELNLSPRDLRRLLQSLSQQAGVEILSSLPFLVVKLPKWSGTTHDAAKTEAHAYSYSKQLSNRQQLKDSYRHDEDHAREGLLQDILETLGETDPGSFRKAVENYSPYAIRTALNRVRRAKSIRKNRTALFRHLLPRIAKDQQLSQPNTP